MKDSAARFNPFPGLRSFEPREEHLFFGRELHIDELLKRLRRTRFLAVMGISGSGKSSLVLSGLIPSLHRGLMIRAGSGWRVAIFRPGDDPIGNLASALNAPDVLGGKGDQAELKRSLVEATLRRGALECVREAREVNQLPKHDNVLVVVDQFEELFRFKTSSENSDNEALAFVKLLQEAARQQEVPLYVVLTMRTDFMEHCVEFPGLPEAINDGAFLVSRMSREEQRAAIVGPVAVGGGTIAPRLVLRLLNSVGDDLDQLPVLQHSLMRTWDHWQKGESQAPTLDLEQYEAIGTMERTLSQHAEEVYEDLDGERQLLAEKMFKALTDKTLGRRGVRRPIQVREVCELTGADTDEVIAVVDRFRQPGRSFLMPPVTVEIAADSVIDSSHESLMRVWDRLWRSLLALDPERGAGLRLGSAVRTVGLAADGTLAAGAEDGHLYLRRPVEEPRPVTWPTDEATVEGSAETTDGQDEIRSLAVSSAGTSLAAGTFRGAVLLWDLETWTARRLGEHRTAAPEVEGDVTATVSALAFDPSDGLFSGSFNGEIRRWDPEEGSEELWLAAGTPTERVLALAVSRDGTRLAAAHEGGSEPAVEQEPLLGHTASVNALRFSPQRDLLASASSDESLRLWSYRANTEPVVLDGHTSWVWTLAWSADGTVLISGSSDRTVRSWATRNRQLTEEICRSLERQELSEAEWSRYMGADIPHETTCPERL